MYFSLNRDRIAVPVERVVLKCSRKTDGAA
jgi:hypothetical protein